MNLCMKHDERESHIMWMCDNGAMQSQFNCIFFCRNKGQQIDWTVENQNRKIFMWLHRVVNVSLHRINENRGWECETFDAITGSRFGK